MSYYWSKPLWTKAVCECGANIWDSGGDPDMGECYDCAERRFRRQDSEAAEAEEYYREMDRAHEAEGGTEA